MFHNCVQDGKIVTSEQLNLGLNQFGLKWKDIEIMFVVKLP